MQWEKLYGVEKTLVLMNNNFLSCYKYIMRIKKKKKRQNERERELRTELQEFREWLRGQAVSGCLWLSSEAKQSQYES